MTARVGDEAAVRRRSLFAILLSMLVAGLTLGLTAPLLSLVLAARGVDPTTIGAMAAMGPLAILLTARFAPHVVRVLGPVPAMIVGLVVGSASLASFPYCDEVWMWFALRFTMGIGVVLPWIVAESWVNRLATEATRGRVVALYATFWATGIAVGPQVIVVTGTDGAEPFTVGALILLLAILPLLPAIRIAPPFERHDTAGGWRTVASYAPRAIGTAVLAGFAEMACFATLPLYAASRGMSAPGAATLMTCFSVGGLAAQPALGWLADRMSRARLLRLVTLCGALAVLLLALVIETQLRWPVAVLFGGLVMAQYTLGLVLLGQRFSVAALVGANATYIAAYTLGSVVGPPTLGAAIAVGGAVGFPVAMALAFLLAALLLRGRDPPQEA